LRIGIFTNCYHPLINGVVGAISLLKKGFLEQGHEVTIFAPAVDDYRDDEEGVYRYHSVDLTRKVKYPVAVPFSRKINRILRELDLDIIHSHHPFVLGPVAVKAAAEKRIPVIYTFHTQYEQYNHYIPLPPSLVTRITRQKVKRFCNRVDGLTTPAESAQRILLDYGVTKPIQVIPNPTVVTATRPDGNLIREKYGIKNEKILINIGRIAPEKNLGLLLQSFKLLLDREQPNSLKLLIVGDGSELGSLRSRAAELGLGERIIFTGLVAPPEVPNYLAAADLFVMTSTSEVKPLVQLEALAAGVPVVAVAAAGANDTITHDFNGLLVREDADVIGEAILSLLNDRPRFERLRENAAQTAARYAYPKIAAEYLEFYHRVIEEYQQRFGGEKTNETN